jgi:hypothetical protein
VRKKRREYANPEMVNVLIQPDMTFMVVLVVPLEIKKNDKI